MAESSLTTRSLGRFWHSEHLAELPRDHGLPLAAGMETVADERLAAQLEGGIDIGQQGSTTHRRP